MRRSGRLAERPGGRDHQRDRWTRGGTGAAVIGGRHMAEHISERAVAIAGGVLFCLFGAHSLVTGLEE